MEKNKQLLLRATAYSKIKALKEEFSKAAGRKITFNEIIDEFMGKQLRFIVLPADIRNYIETFVKSASKERDVVGIMLFGSVIKGTFNEFSDIDILVIAEDATRNLRSRLSKIQQQIEPLRDAFVKRGSHLRISVLLLATEDLKTFRPIYLDLLDYGLTLYDCNDTLADFLMSMRRIKHERRFSERGEMLSWKT